MAYNGPSVHTGFWVDYSKGGVILGATLTYNSKWGSQLVSAATVLVQLIGAAVWTLAAFWLHQHAVSGKLRDEFEAQKQVIIRNSGSTTAVLSALWHLASTWHGHARRAWMRALGHMILPAIIFIGFAVAGVFVGQIAEDPFRSRVLLTPGKCGNVKQADSSAAAYARLVQLITNTSIISDSYARNCYGESSAQVVACSSFAKARLEYTKANDPACPFGVGHCAMNDSAVVSFQATHIDSHDDLGINAKPEDRIQFSYNATCAPLSHALLNNLTTYDNTSGLQDSTRAYPTLQLHLGHDSTIKSSIPFNYSTALKHYSSGFVRYGLKPFKTWYPATLLNPLNTFVATSPFNQLHGDISIFAITPNQITYTQPSQDPVFSTYDTPTSAGNYLSDQDVAVISCTESYQICNGPANCTNWSPLLPLYTGSTNSLGLNPAQNATWVRIAETFAFADMYFAASIPSPFRASDLMTSATTSVGLPNDQWVQEVEAWFQSALAQMQYLNRIFVQLPESLVTENNLIVVPPSTDVGKAQCSQQLIQTPPGYSSYNVFALILILVLALLIIGFALWLSNYGHTLPHRRPGQKNYAKVLAYQGDGMLQLHRMALEAAGYRGWKSGTGHKKEVPYVEIAQERLPPPVIVNDTDGSIYSGEDSIKDSLLYYMKRQSLKPFSGDSIDRRKKGDTFSWIRLDEMSEYRT